MLKMKKILGLGLIFWALTACGNDAENSPKWIELLFDMYQSVPYNAYDPNPNFKDGKTLQHAPAGTVPMGFVPYPFAKDPSGMDQAASLKNPFEKNDDLLARGEKAYKINCMACHGPEGKGDGLVIGPTRFAIAPPSCKSERVQARNEGQIYHVISNGFGLMPNYDKQISQADRWAIVYYFQNLMNK